MTSQPALPYEEPGIRTVLIQSGLLLVLNFANWFLDKLVYCGLIGQIFIGVTWGMPGAQWLTHEAQEMMQQLGYLGLLLLVYEGGLSTSFTELKAHFTLSAIAAFTGVATPMGLSFILMPLVDATPLQAFGAGAALCSTSIGTTFTILSTTGLAKSRLGTVLSGAAMMDDVAGLVMVQTISNLGNSSTESFSAVTIVRPVCAAIGCALGILLVCSLAVAPAARKLYATKINLLPKAREIPAAFVLHMAILVGFVAGASYAGTSGLFAAYLAGACISWFDDLMMSIQKSIQHRRNTTSATSDASLACLEMARRASASNAKSQPNTEGSSPSSMDSSASAMNQDNTRIIPGQQTFDLYCKQPLHYILCPFFFASVGFAIPVTQMFQGEVVWRGIVYTLLMALGKIVTGIWILPITISPLAGLIRLRRAVALPISWCMSRRKQDTERHLSSPNKKAKKAARPPRSPADTSTSQQSSPNEVRSSTLSERSTSLEKTRSLYPASIFGLAMIARGEIGYLIASVAETGGIFAVSGPGGDKGTDNETSQIYLVVVWAITLCTTIGPICVGTLVKRVKSLQAQRSQSGSPDPLGVWGVS
ncbi:uncharacterized protein N7482_000928 [Penicillium canariense]|uniref:Cation/H+ exchanger transmembrane domain-containing protein n=1 Tax=Penicillium canariense TaxID=189055 RepID=A0A9W9IG89_9EURO|nr:uncharacterized protein N7482_000928 [Penicillium canariense]KAJ5175051.1 hypothetical protein N7482_000928 [Penicillium canariense]